MINALISMDGLKNYSTSNRCSVLKYHNYVGCWRSYFGSGKKRLVLTGKTRTLYGGEDLRPGSELTKLNSVKIVVKLVLCNT